MRNKKKVNQSVFLSINLAFQDPDLVRPEAAVHRVAGAPQLQGRSVHLR
jgi:hypothetical protein